MELGGVGVVWGVVGRQTGDFPVRWLLPLKLSAYHCSLIIVTNYHPLWIMVNSFLLSIEPILIFGFSLHVYEHLG